MAKKPTILRFRIRTTDNPVKVMEYFYPQGKTVLNRSEWHGKEPRSCGVTDVSIRTHKAGDPTIIDVEVTFRPKGYKSFVGNTMYDGWTAMVLDQQPDGTLLDGKGQPLPDGEEPVYLAYEVYDDIDFNKLEFGEFVGEFDADPIKHLDFDEVMSEIRQSPSVSTSLHSDFMAARRHRPSVRLILSGAPTGRGRDGFGTLIVNINELTPDLERAIVDELTELLCGFMEGRYSIPTMTNGEMVYVDLNKTFVDCRPNEQGEDSRFDCLHEFLPDSSLEDLVKRLISTYQIEVSIVDGRSPALLIRNSRSA